MGVLVINTDTADLGDTGEPSYLARTLARRGCEVLTASSMREGLALLGEADVALLHVGHRDADTVAAIDTVRAESDLPLVVMAAKASPDRCAEALLVGADDYVPRLVNIDELMARIHVLLRRHHGSRASSWSLVTGDVEIDLERRIVLVAGNQVELTTREFRILSIIARQGGRVCTTDKLTSTIWGDTHQGAGEQLRAHIAALRAKLARPRLIETVEFVGYRLRTRPTMRSTHTAPATCAVEGA